MEDNDKAEEAKVEEAAPEKEQPAEKKRSVVISADVSVVFTTRYDDGRDILHETVKCPRDVFSVIDAVMSRMKDMSKDEFDATTVSIHSIEDEEKSEKPAEGEPRWEGPYGVGGVSVEDMKISEAMKALSAAVIPNDVALMNVERIAEQLFLRSRLDGFVFIGTFDGLPAVIPLLSSFRDQKPETFAMLYRQMHLQAENLKEWATKKFPEIASHVNWTGREGGSGKLSGLVLPNGRPVETVQRPRVPGLGCGGKPGKFCGSVK